MKKTRTEWFTARAGLVLSSSTLLMAVNPAAAQFDPDDPLIVPGRVVAAVLNDRIITDIERDIKAITGLTPSVGEKNHPYIDFKFSVPSDNDAREALRDVFENADSSGQLKWWDGVAVIDGTGGQTGSLWVSSDGLDRQKFIDQQAWQSIGLVAGSSAPAWSDPRRASKGGDVLVAVLDTGVDGSHTTFGSEYGNRVAPFGESMIPGDPNTNDAGNGLDDDGDGIADEMVGHGTFLAGLVSHMAPHAGILPIRVLDSDGRGNTQQLGAGIMSAIEKGAHVIVIALGTYELAIGIPSPGALFVEEAIELAVDRGITVVASVGNRFELSGDRCLFPADLPEVIAVGGSNGGGGLALVSNVTELTTVFAPAEITGASVEDQIIGPVPGNTYRAATGTSMSTAFVAGAAALVRAQHPNWPNSKVAPESISTKIGERLELSSSDIVFALESGNLVLRPSLDLQSALDFSIDAEPPDGDVNADGKVDGVDLGVMLGWWSQLPTDGTLHRPDQNRDFVINGADLGFILGNW